MRSIFTREAAGKDKAFTHKSQYVKRIEGRGEGKNGKSLSAQCAGAGVSANVPTRVSERDECVGRADRTGTKGDAQSEREGAGAQKEGVRRRNKGRRDRKSASFQPQTVEFKMHELFIARKVGFIERKYLFLQPNKHNIHFFCRNAASI